MLTPSVSIITPTYNREDFLPSIYRCFAAQKFPVTEWLILDDSPEPSAFLRNINDPRIRYQHDPNKLSVGEKRNRLVDRATGEIIVHFDDDDYYGPEYIGGLFTLMQQRNADLMNLRGWFIYDKRHHFFGYWNLLVKEGLHYVCGSEPPGYIVLDKTNNEGIAKAHLGYGFGWMYKKQVWRASPFPDLRWNSDGEFALKAQENFKLDGVNDTRGHCLHIIHAGNVSRCFPQYQIPNFMLPRVFPDAMALIS